MEQYLYVEHDFRLPASGVSGLPAASVVANPGVWEDARHAYVHEMLIRHTGCSAALAVLYASVMQLLLSAGKIEFAVRVDCTAADQLPTAQVGYLWGVVGGGTVIWTLWWGLVLIPVVVCDTFIAFCSTLLGSSSSGEWKLRVPQHIWE